MICLGADSLKDYKSFKFYARGVADCSNEHTELLLSSNLAQLPEFPH